MAMYTYLRGDAIENATSYELFEKASDGTYISLATASEINFELSAMDFTAGDHTLVVKAHADGYASSFYSNEVVYTVEAVAPAEMTTFGSDNVEVEVINNFADFVFVDGAVISTSGGSQCKFSTGTSRATSTTQVLKITGGQKLKFSQVISGVTLQYAVVEFKTTPCTLANFNTSGEVMKAWLSADVTTHADTNYVAFNFNRGSGNFSADELELLKTAIVVE